MSTTSPTSFFPTGLLFALVVVMVPSCANAEADDEEAVAMADLPAPVAATVEEYAAGRTIECIEIDREDGSTVYDVELESAGGELEFSVAPDGTFLGYEDEENDDDGDDEDDD
jgi:hypothetical protein